MKTSTRQASPLAYTCSEYIRWLFDGDRVIIIDERTRRCFVLIGEEAAVWSWLTLSYPFDRLRRQLTALLVLSPTEAEVRLREMVTGWLEAGLLKNTIVESDGRGASRG